MAVGETCFPFGRERRDSDHVNAACARADDREIRFIHSAKTPGDIIFRAELEALAARFPNVKVTLVCGQGGPAWTGSTGRIDGRMLLSLVPDLHKRTLFACGPEGYMKTARACLDAIGFPPAQYHEESFGGSNGSRPKLARRFRLRSVLSARVWSIAARPERPCWTRRGTVASTSPLASRAFAEPAE
ncbi:hypothetical protein [Mesorhizobium sp. M0292]|uniref:hypothetical protein n=1 Tax=Mesorhizobium sp. M0292 TaxID=2956929 RepID=UPI0012DE3809